MEVFGPWLPLLFGLGTLLLVGGLVKKEAASDRFLKSIGRGAANVGWRMMLFATTMYLLVLALSAAFESMLSNLPGAWELPKGRKPNPKTSHVSWRGIAVTERSARQDVPPDNRHG